MKRAQLAALLVTALTVGMTGGAWAAIPVIKVGNGTAASCTEAALRAAVANATVGGGIIRFKCGSAAVTILISEPLVIPDQTTIDGDDLVTLQALPINNAFLSNLLEVAPGSTVVLKSLTLRLGWQVVFNQGDLTVRQSAVAGSVIHNLTNAFGGILTVIDTAICCEVSDISGGGIANSGTLVVRRSTFSDSYGGGIHNVGTASIDGSTFTRNRYEHGPGGAIENFGTMTISDSTFSDNVALGRGGAIDNGGTLTVRRSTFTGNNGQRGGGISNTGTLTVIDSEITGNTGRLEGGGIYTCCGGTTTLKRTSVTGNIPDDLFTEPLP